MRQLFPSRVARPLSTFVLWALAFASTAFWILRLSAPAATGPYPPAAVPAPADPDTLAMARALGAVQDVPITQASAPAAGRFALLGVLAGSTHAGAALIAVDGQPAKPFRVGSTVAPGYVLQSVAPRRAVLGADSAGSPGSGLTVDMPALR